MFQGSCGTFNNFVVALTVVVNWVVLVPREHLTTSGDIFGCHNLRGTIDIQWVEVKDTADRGLDTLSNTRSRVLTNPGIVWDILGSRCLLDN